MQTFKTQYNPTGENMAMSVADYKTKAQDKMQLAESGSITKAQLVHELWELSCAYLLCSKEHEAHLRDVNSCSLTEKVDVYC